MSARIYAAAEARAMLDAATPGPWRRQRRAVLAGDEVVAVLDDDRTNHYDLMIDDGCGCEREACPRCYPTLVADADLCAAAPDLAASVAHWQAKVIEAAEAGLRAVRERDEERVRIGDELRAAREALAAAARGRAFICEECQGEGLATQLDDGGNPLCDKHAAAEVIVDRRDVEHAGAIRAALAEVPA